MMSARRPTRSHPIAAIAVLILILCGCQQSVPPGPPTARVSSGGGVIAWTRDPAFVLFRAEIVGGEAFAAMSQVPLCTLYGDNRIVWTDITDTRDANVLEDRLSDAVISTFIAYLTVNERIYTFEEKLTDRATSGNTMPIVERVTIAVNDTVHRANGLSGWESGWFERVLSACRNLSAAPVLIAPAAGWLSAREVAFTVEAPLIFWDAERTGIALAQYTNTPGWVSGAGAVELWTRIRAIGTSALYQEGDRTYQVALQVPGVTYDAPPPPAASS